MFDSLRSRLTAWYVGVLSLVLLIFSVAVYVFVARSSYERLDAGLDSATETVASLLRRRSGTQKIPAMSVSETLQALQFPNQAIAVFNAEGQLLGDRPAADRTHVRLPPSASLSARSRTVYTLPERTSESDDGCRGIAQPLRIGNTNSYLIVVSQSLEPLTEQLDALLNILCTAVPVALGLTGLGGWFLARRSLAPVAAISERAQQIRVENLDQRLPIGNPRDELGRLANTFNELFSRLSEAFALQRQFMANASHELRTPLSSIRTAATVILQREDREKEEYREALAIVEQQSQRLTRIVDDLFLLARADAGHPAMQITSFYLDELLRETARAANVLASCKNLTIEVLPAPESLFHGDEELLRQMMWNLLDNAIKYSSGPCAILVELSAYDAQYMITVADAGLGIPPHVATRIFERFYRGDSSRSSSPRAMENGAGLGLPIARWIAESHRGRLELLSSDHTGTTFGVFLPRD